MGFTYYDSDAIQQHDQESLQHYYEKTGEYGYHYKSHATKKYDRKAAKYASKADKVASKGYNEKNQKKSSKLIEKAEKFKNRANRSRELDAREQAAAKKISTGKAIVSRLLVGGTASKAYQQYNAMAGGNPGAATKGVSAVKAYYGGTLGSRAAKAAYIRKGEKNHGIVNRINKNMEKENKALQAADREAERRKKKWTNG